jgi:hypothetical protein
MQVVAVQCRFIRSYLRFGTAAGRNEFWLKKPLNAGRSVFVCGSLHLCVELLLKCSESGVKVPLHQEGELLANAEIFSNLKVGGHDLEKMFNKIDKEISGQLCVLYHECTGGDLQVELTKCKDYFVHARYAYELDSAHAYNVSAIKQLADGLIKALLKGWGPSEPA